MRDIWWQRVLMFPLLVIGFVISFLMEHSETILRRGWQVWDFIKGLGELTEALLQALGRIAVSLFLAIGLFVLYYQSAVELGYPQPQLKPAFDLVLRIFDNKVMLWVVPLILGATLGILHLWKLQLDRRRYGEELRTLAQRGRRAGTAAHGDGVRADADEHSAASTPEPQRLK